MSDDRRTEAAAWLGLPDPPGGIGPRLAETLSEAVVAAITDDDLGTVPPELVTALGWEGLSPEDREQIVRFGRFLAAVGRPGDDG